MPVCTIALAWVASTAGYLFNPNDMANCGYCPYSRGVDYMATLNIRPEHKWRNFSVFFGFS